eukprot:5711416-Alexandrium_andersonii.AAC.1
MRRAAASQDSAVPRYLGSHDAQRAAASAATSAWCTRHCLVGVQCESLKVTRCAQWELLQLVQS